MTGKGLATKGATRTPTSSPGAPAPSRRRKLVQRTVVGGGLALGVGLALWASAAPFGARLVLGLTVVLSLWSIVEADRIGLTVSRGAALAAGAATLACAALAFGWLDPSSSRRFPADWTPTEVWWRGLGVVVATGAVVGLLGSLPGLGAGQRPVARRRALPTPVIVLWIALPLLTLYPLRSVLGVEGLAAFLLLAKIGDVAGYYVGNAIGETHPFPRVSPGKTTAGCVASLVAGVVAGVLVQLVDLLPEGNLGLASGAVAGLLVNLAAQSGDLLESAAKRRVGVKDTAHTFGPSGGLLDLVDSLLLAGPVALATWPFLFHWPLA